MKRDPSTPYLAALATLLAAGTLLPVLTSNTWAWSALLVVALVTVTGIALRAVTRTPALVVAGQAALGAIAVTMLYARDQAVLGFLPGPEALRTLAGLANDGLAATRQFATPAPPVRGITFLLTLGVLAVAVAVDAFAVTWGTSVAAGLPLLVLYCVPAAVLPGGASWVSFAMVAGGWLILLGHDGRLRVNGWGRVLRKGPDNGRRRFGEDDLEVMGASARRLGALTVAAAIVVPMLLPSLADGLINPSGQGTGTGIGDGPGATSIDPILTLRQNLTTRSTAPVLTYTTNQASPPTLRLVTDDQFDGATWKTSDGRRSANHDLAGDLPAPPGLATTVGATAYTMRVKVTTLTQQYLPVPYPARNVDVNGRWAYSEDDLDIVSRGGTTKGLGYSVDYLDVQPTVTQLQAAGAPSQDLVDRYTRVPDYLSPKIAELAKRITAKATTEYDKAAALQAYFRTSGGFTYDTTVDTSNSADAVSVFLASKRGYCVQFSSAMAVMARMLGIPARIGVGFLPGIKVTNGKFSVSLNDAHAWPELYFEGAGWVRFEPTPAVRTGAAPTYSEPAAANAAINGASASAAVTGSASASANAKIAKDNLPIGEGKSGLGGAASRATNIPVKVWVLLGLLVLAALATPAAALVARWRRRRGARDATARAEAAWAELLDRVGDLGIELPGGATPRQTQARLRDGTSLGDAATDALARLVRDIEQARYAPRPALRPDGSDPDEDISLVVRAVRASTDRSRRLRARVLPRSGTEQLLGISARAGERLAGVDRRIARTGRSVTRGPGARSGPRRRARIFGGRPH